MNPYSKPCSIFSPMVNGSGAIVVHRMLENHLKDYQVAAYHPAWTLVPPVLFSLYRNRKPKLIHTTPDHGLFFYRRSTPMVCTFHNYVLDEEMRQYSHLYQRIHYATDLKWFYRQSVKLASQLTAVSQFTADLAKRHMGLAQDIRVIYNGIDEQQFIPTKAKMNHQRIRVLYSGNLSTRKGAPLLPMIADQLSDGVEIAYTTGMRVKSALARHSKLVPLGSRPHSQMPGLYQSADMLLLPSVREGFCLAVLEAMACGLPIIAARTSSLAEQVIEGRGGYLCTPWDASEFSEKIEHLANSPQLRLEMGDFNRSRIESLFTLDHMVKQYDQCFEEVLDAGERERGIASR